MEVQEVSDQKNMNQLLMGEGGFVKKFINGPVEPFLSRSLKKGYYAKKVMGRNIDFNEYFLSFLTKGAKAARPVKGTYSVNIRAYPTGANTEARVRPHETSLELRCESDTIKLMNFNYPVKKPVISSKFGVKRNYYYKNKLIRISYHYGVDFKGTKRTSVYASNS